MWYRSRGLVLIACLITTGSDSSAGDDEPVFSGPQAGEKLVPFKVRGVFDDLAGKDFDFIGAAGGEPVLLVFVHKKTRPAFGLTNALMNYAAKRRDDGLHGGVVFLTSDATETENWMKVVRRHFATGPQYGIYLDGEDGPGAYGLNRNVTLTVLVGEGNKVTANFALVQPSLQADGPRIGRALAALLGGEPPTVSELGGDDYRQPPAMVDLRSLLVPVINKSASAEEVDKAAAAVEKAAAENPAARQSVGDAARRIIAGGKLADYGTPAAQEYLRKWAKEFTESGDRK